MIKIVEPQWGIELLQSLYAWMQASSFWSYRIPILADIFVFVYPVYLLGLYIYGIVEIKKYQRGKMKDERGMYHKIASLYVLAGVGISVIVNICIQFFVDKVRPNVILGLTDLKHETILHQFLPSSSFPSDHAALTMSIAMMTLFRGIQHHDKKFLRGGGILIVFSVITGFARVSSGVHWPTDIIAGSIVGIIIPLVLMWKPVYRLGTWIAEKIGKVV